MKSFGLPFSASGINVKQSLKQTIMKFVKLSIFALTMGLFVASCGGNTETTTETTTDSTTVVTPEPAPAPVDTTAAPAADTTTATTTTTTTTEQAH
jgi:Predicted solute binding protein